MVFRSLYYVAKSVERGENPDIVTYLVQRAKLFGLSRLALKIVVMALGLRQEARGKSEEGLGDFTFLYTDWFYCVYLLSQSYQETTSRNTTNQRTNLGGCTVKLTPMKLLLYPDIYTQNWDIF